MATPTSSSNRSKRKATKPVTTDKGRNNRAKVSTAKPTSTDTRSTNSGARVTNASQRVSSGSAKVTGTSKPALPARSSASDLQRLQTASRTKPTRPAPRTAPKPQAKPALPPGQKGGALVPTGTRRTRAEAKAATAAQGSTGPNRIGRSDARPALPQGRQGGPLAKGTPGGAMTRAAQTAAKAGRFGRVAGPFGAALAAVDQARNVFNPKDNILTRGAQLGRSIERVVGGGGGGNMTPAQRAAQLKAKRGDYAGPGGKSDGSGQGQARQTTPRVNKARQDQMRADLNRDYPLTTANQRRGSSQSGGGPTQSRSGGGGSSRPAAPAPRRQAPAAPAKPFGGTVSEGRKIWAEKYSSSKYDGQAIQKEAKALLKKMKEEKNTESAAKRAGWDGNKNY